MNKAKSVKQVLKLIGSEHLGLVKGQGAYWYFVYDKPGIYETDSVFVNRLSELTLEDWADTGKQFVERIG